MNNFGIKKNLLLIVILASGYFADSNADQFFTGYSYFNTYSARTLPLGNIQINAQGRIYRKSDGWGEGTDLIDASGIFGINFGYNNNLEFGANMVFYQDLNKNAALADDKELVDTNTPDATYLRFKYRGDEIEIGNSMLALWGVATSFRYLSKQGNVILEPFSTNNMQFNTTAIFSLYMDQLYLDETQSFHLNLGYVNHNNSNRYNSFSGFSHSAMEFTYGLDYTYPMSYVDLNLELSGAYVFNLDSIMEKQQASIKPYLYITPSIKYKAFAGLSFDIGCDILLMTKYDNYSQSAKDGYKGSLSLTEVPYYAPWRLLLRTNYTPSTPYVDVPAFASSTGMHNRVSRSRQVSSRKELFEWLIEEPDRVEYIDMKLDKLRNERKDIENNIEQLKEELQSE